MPKTSGKAIFENKDEKSETCWCGISVYNGAYICGFLGVLLSGIGFVGSYAKTKYLEAVIEAISTLTYLLVFVGRYKNNHHYYLPLLIVHALAIPIIAIVGVLATLIYFRFVQFDYIPEIFQLNFMLEATTTALPWTIYNLFTSFLELYFFKVVYKAYMRAKRMKKDSKK